MKLLALSGSLREASYNTAAIQALKLLAPPHIDITIGSIGDLPLFNPDREDEQIPALEDLSKLLKQADGLILASPEYAHGVSGPMKNALDWLVGGPEFPYKPIMLINTSPRATHAQESLREIIRTMSGVLIEGAHVSIPLLSRELGIKGILRDHEMVQALRTGLQAFCRGINETELNHPLN